MTSFHISEVILAEGFVPNYPSVIYQDVDLTDAVSYFLYHGIYLGWVPDVSLADA